MSEKEEIIKHTTRVLLNAISEEGAKESTVEPIIRFALSHFESSIVSGDIVPKGIAPIRKNS